MYSYNVCIMIGRETHRRKIYYVNSTFPTSNGSILFLFLILRLCLFLPPFLTPNLPIFLLVAFLKKFSKEQVFYINTRINLLLRTLSHNVLGIHRFKGLVPGLLI